MTIADINTLARFLCDADTTSLTAANLLIFVNQALEELVGLIINADGTFDYDDTNYTTDPIGIGTLVNAQQVYAITSEYLNIKMVEILDAASPAVYRKIQPISSLELGDLSPEEYFGVTSGGDPQTGWPEYYDKLGDSLILYPTPTSTYVTLASGIRIWFTRTAQLYTSAEVTTGTKEPGLPSPYHQLIAYMAALPYCQLFKQDRVPMIMAKIQEGKKELVKHYGLREKDKKHFMTMKPVTGL